MIWFLLSISVAAISAIINLLDKHILAKYLRSPIEAVSVLGVFSVVFIAILFPLRIYFSDAVYSGFSWFSFYAGFFEVVYIYLYLKAIDKEDVAYMVPIFALAPIFSLLPAWFLLKQGVALLPILGILVVLLGLLIMAWSKRGKFVMPSKYYGYMVMASFFYAIHGVFLGKGLENTNFLDNLLLSRIGVIAGSIYLLLVSRKLTSILVLNKKSYVFLVSEGLYILSVWLFIVAISVGPVAYVMGVVNIQPVFVLLLCILLWGLQPQFLAERESVHFSRPLVTFVGVLIVVLGSFLVYL